MRTIFLAVLMFAIISGCVHTAKEEPRLLSLVDMKGLQVGVFGNDDTDLLSELLDAGLRVNNLYSLQGNFNPCTQNMEQSNADDNPVLGHSLLYLAASSSATNCMAKLIEYGADVNLKSTSGATVLFACSRIKGNGSVVWAEWLLDNSCLNVMDEDSGGKTALQCAVSTGNLDLMRFLIEHGAELNHPYDKLQSGVRDHWTLFDVMNSSSEVVDYYFSLPDVNFSVVDKRGRSALFHISPALADYVPRVGKIVSRGIDINYEDNDDSIVKELVRWSTLYPITSERICALRDLGLKDEVVYRGAVYAKRLGREEECNTLLLAIRSGLHNVNRRDQGTISKEDTQGHGCHSKLPQ